MEASRNKQVNQIGFFDLFKSITLVIDFLDCPTRISGPKKTSTFIKGQSYVWAFSTRIAAEMYLICAPPDEVTYKLTLQAFREYFLFVRGLGG